MFLLSDIQLSKSQQEKHDLLFREAWLYQLLCRNALLQLVLRCFQLIEPLLGGFIKNPLLNRIQHMIDCRFRFLQLLFIMWKP